MADIDGMSIHFYHVRGKDDSRPIPILLTHGWPGSVVEFQAVPPRLVEAGLTVVVPSLPGFASEIGDDGLQRDPGLQCGDVRAREQAPGAMNSFIMVVCSGQGISNAEIDDSTCRQTGPGVLPASPRPPRGDRSMARAWAGADQDGDECLESVARLASPHAN